jgi:hypothetical protein
VEQQLLLATLSDRHHALGRQLSGLASQVDAARAQQQAQQAQAQAPAVEGRVRDKSDCHFGKTVT